MKQELLQAQALHKRYGTREAVRGLSLTVGAGEVLGLLGPMARASPAPSPCWRV